MPIPLLNCDVGESFGAWKIGRDADVMAYIDCANIACGFHAGDPDVMRRTVGLAVANNVAIGAHPGYPDLVGFGRRSLAVSPTEAENLLLYQIGALDGVCRAEGSRVRYIKPHGALYNDMAVNSPAGQDLLRATMRAVRAYDASLPLLVMSTADTDDVRALAAEEGVSLWFEVFADRAYDQQGRLVSRREPGAVHHDESTIVAQAVTLAKGEPLAARDGTPLQLPADTLCVHGDNESSVAAVRAIREAFDRLEEA
ncbi:LamB/YcsF family protein [Halomonas sp. DP8Y7-3]|uniref:5-oxoprolinase subunit PxpA n=1 Tax=Halomonas sp. DP8Y7-3 TaxID=2859079 RepID=UPI001C97D580|nr:5-oxoprolinase subunit PxpA [Halomonas sp. DP8Y7-3]MBY5928163.1 LamB/YcsF family protein [Halomonas sp. DP8Y7-3]